MDLLSIMIVMIMVLIFYMARLNKTDSFSAQEEKDQFSFTVFEKISKINYDNPSWLDRTKLQLAVPTIEPVVIDIMYKGGLGNFVVNENFKKYLTAEQKEKLIKYGIPI